MMLYFKLAGQEGVCGPLPMDAASQGLSVVSVRPPRSSTLYRTHLAFHVSSPGSAERGVVLHSGIQVG
jgi:hypothetical protein